MQTDVQFKNIGDIGKGKQLLTNCFLICIQLNIKIIMYKHGRTFFPSLNVITLIYTFV